MSYKRITVGEINDMPSMTVPGHAMTIKEMLDRAVRGLPIPVNKFTEYDEDPDFDDVDPLGQMGVDKFDIQDRAIELSHNLKNPKTAFAGGLGGLKEKPAPEQDGVGAPSVADPAPAHE